MARGVLWLCALQLFGEVALLFDKPREFTVRAVEDSTAWMLSRRSYVLAFQDATRNRTKRRVMWLRSIPFFATADEGHLESLAVALKPVSLKAGEALTRNTRSSVTENQQKARDGYVYLVESGTLSRDGEQLATAKSCFAVCPDDAHDSLKELTAEWDECRKEYISVGLHVKNKMASEDVAKLIENRDQQKAQAQPPAPGGRRRRASNASAIGIGALERLVATHEAAMDPAAGSISGMPMVDPSNGPVVEASGGGASLFVLRKSQFIELVKPMHRLIIDWEDLREHFAALPYSPGPEMFDDIHPLLNEQRAFKEGQVVLKQGEKNNTVFLMLEGEATVSIDVGGGKMVMAASRRRGDFFGERTMLGLAPANTATITAKTRVVCAIFDAGEVGTPSRKELPPILRTHLEMVAKHHVIPEKLELGQLEHISDLGAGAFGTVMLMRHRQDHRPIALKCLLRDEIKKKSHRDHVLSEKRLMVELRHPFLVNLIGTFKDAGRLFLAMEYIISGELFSYMGNNDGRLKPEEVPFVVASVAAMIEHIHSRSFVYRDLKPENLMVTGSGYLKLIDFGFCKELAKSQRTFTAVGTLEYMAPEVLNLAAGHGFEADWWSLGVLTYECWHGCSPFIKNNDEASDREIMEMIRDTNFELDMDDDVPQAASDLIAGLLQHDSSLRFDAVRLRGSEYFSGFNWIELLSRQMKTPLDVEGTSDPFDTAAFDPDEMDEGRSGAELLGLSCGSYDDEVTDKWDILF